MQALDQQFGGLIMQATPPHIDGLDLGGAGGSDGLIIAFADHEIIAHHPPERGERQDMGDQTVAAQGADVETQLVIDHRQRQRIGAALIMAGQSKVVGLDQVINGDRPFMLLFRRGSADGYIIEIDRSQTVPLCLRHVSLSQIEPDGHR